MCPVRRGRPWAKSQKLRQGERAKPLCMAYRETAYPGAVPFSKTRPHIKSETPARLWGRVSAGDEGERLPERETVVYYSTRNLPEPEAHRSYEFAPRPAASPSSRYGYLGRDRPGGDPGQYPVASLPVCGVLVSRSSPSSRPTPTATVKPVPVAPGRLWRPGRRGKLAVHRLVEGVENSGRLASPPSSW